MIRNIAFAAAFTFIAGPAFAQGMTQQQLQQMQGAPPVQQPLRPAQPQTQMQTKPQMPEMPLRPSVNNAPTLQQIGSSLQQISQQLQSYGAQQKGNPQTVAMVQALLMQAEYMRNVAAIVYQQSQASNSVSPGDKMKMQSMKQSAESVAPKMVQQKQIADKGLKEQQAKLEEAAKKMEQAEKNKQAKDQGGPLVNVQVALLQLRARLDQIMLAEMAD